MKIQDEFWQLLPEIFRSPDREVRVWRCNIKFPPVTVEALEKLLEEEEQAKAKRFHFSKDRDRYILGRGLLRLLLGHYLQQDPQSLQFAYSAKGKPFLKDEAVQFNLSHSGDLIVLGMSRDRAIGVDVEQIHPLPDALKLARRFFCEAEWEKIRTLPSNLTSRAFFTAWTRKEAFLKATGDGIAGLKDVEVSLLPDEPIQIYRIAGKIAKGWQLQSLDLGEEYVGAMVVSTKEEMTVD
ncbi:MAG: 4'-phosphopantetheinyl transferase superfamily protein [Cyanobacteria bacterium SBLK]|nr:4'-phosphopantetheinyl transferase superfamily protein [Cyanobacteria bacterium SBLK]